MYSLPKFKLLNKNKSSTFRKVLDKLSQFLLREPITTRKFLRNFWCEDKRKGMKTIILVVVLSSVIGFLAGSISSIYFYLQIRSHLQEIDINLPPITGEKNTEKETTKEKDYVAQSSQEQATVKAVKEISPAVVSIIVSKDVPVFEQFFYEPFKELEEFFGPSPKIPQYRQKGTQRKEIGGGTGVIVSADGIILTNKHVVLDEEADYTIYTNDGRKFSAKVLARDPFQDLAILKIEQEQTTNHEGEIVVKPFSVAKLGDSDVLEIGQTVIAIGNALGEFRNTVSVGVISGLGRRITASGGSFIETLEDVIQTDAAINRGNSGGPLLNLKGEVIGVNTAMASGAQSIGFAIPINKAKRDIKQVKEIGKIVYPFLGIRYVLINEEVRKEKDLPVNYGVLIVGGEKGGEAETGIWPDSAAEKAGLKKGDIILEFNNEKISPDNSLAKIILKYDPGDKISLKYLRDGEEKIVEVELGERSE